MVQDTDGQVLSLADISADEQREIQELYRKSLLVGSSAQLTGPGGTCVGVPHPVYRLLIQILKDLSEGTSVAIVPAKQGLTTSQASKMLGTSRQFFVNLLKSGQIPFKKVGSHRRVEVQALSDYKHRRDLDRRAALDRMLQSEIETGAGNASLDDFADQ